MSVFAPQAVSQRLTRRLTALGVTPGQLMGVSASTFMFEAQLDGRPVVVKLLRERDPMAGQQHRAEQAAYRAAEAEHCPVRLPQLRYADAEVTILEHLAGRVLHPDRYPGQLPRSAVERVLSMLDRLHTWRPQRLARTPLARETIVGYQMAGLLCDDDVYAVECLLAAAGRQMRVEHAGLHARRLLESGDTFAMVGLEHLVWHLPGRDWAQLRLLWAPTNPWLASELDQRAHWAGISAAYTVNLLLAACDEWRVHHASPHFDLVKPTLAVNLADARSRLHRTAWSLP
ncbi:hypothetical protein AB0B31_10685 [Catellatospora citrea]|uniref:hypothetical protein n=1 Tax=Catellatospora citrea TaxID=53366 RepID=UPI0033EF6B14